MFQELWNGKNLVMTCLKRPICSCIILMDREIRGKFPSNTSETNVNVICFLKNKFTLSHTQGVPRAFKNTRWRNICILSGIIKQDGKWYNVRSTFLEMSPQINFFLASRFLIIILSIIPSFCSCYGTYFYSGSSSPRPPPLPLAQSNPCWHPISLIGNAYASFGG
jgi:hypothetical protein